MIQTKGSFYSMSSVPDVHVGKGLGGLGYTSLNSTILSHTADSASATLPT